MNALQLLPELKHPGNINPQNTAEDQAVQDACNVRHEHINDDFNTAMVLGSIRLNHLAKINAMHHKQLPAECHRIGNL